jgi:autophagy-related protein 101
VVNASIDIVIEEKASWLLRVIEETSGPGQIGIQFFEIRSKKPSWFGKAHEEVCWEQWVITVTATQSITEADREASRQKTAVQLRKILEEIVTTVDSNKSHIPPITTTDATPFPYEIVVIPKSTGDNESWGSVFKKILTDQ